MAFRCNDIPGRPGVYELTRNGQPRVEWDSIGFVATIDGVQYSRVTHFMQAFSARQQQILRGLPPVDYYFYRRPEPELFLSIFDYPDNNLFNLEIREMRKTRQN
jgi:hypothetical protein